MNHTMNFSPMTRFCHDMLKTYQTQNSRAAGSIGFYDKLMENCGSAGGADSTENVSGTESLDRAFIRNMSMEEYKQYIYDRIAALSVDRSNRMDSISVDITKEGFEAMKNDPAYEKWVLDTIEKNLKSYDPWSSMYGGKFTYFRFGATKEEYRCETWRMGFRNGNRERNEDGESFWERRKRRRKELLEELKEMDEKKAIAKRIAQSEYYISLAEMNTEDGKIKEPINKDMLAMQIFSELKTSMILTPRKSNLKTK